MSYNYCMSVCVGLYFLISPRGYEKQLDVVEGAYLYFIHKIDINHDTLKLEGSISIWHVETLFIL